MHLEFHPFVKKEVQSAFDWYEQRSEGLGDRFLVELEKAFDRILENPILFPIHKGKIRRCLVSTFPFGVLFSVQSGRIHILAIMHLKRRPFYWKGRT